MFVTIKTFLKINLQQKLAGISIFDQKLFVWILFHGKMWAKVKVVENINSLTFRFHTKLYSTTKTRFLNELLRSGELGFGL